MLPNSELFVVFPNPSAQRIPNGCLALTNLVLINLFPFWVEGFCLERDRRLLGRC